MATGPQSKDHTGITCPVCKINGVCSHPVNIPPLPPWQPNAWVKAVP